MAICKEKKNRTNEEETSDSCSCHQIKPKLTLSIILCFFRKMDPNIQWRQGLVKELPHILLLLVHMCITLEGKQIMKMN